MLSPRTSTHCTGFTGRAWRCLSKIAHSGPAAATGGNLFGHAVTRHPLGVFPVTQNDLVSAVVDQLLPFETLQRLGNTRPPDAQHQCQKFVCQR